jgi:hypothetical protein
MNTIPKRQRTRPHSRALAVAALILGVFGSARPAEAQTAFQFDGGLDLSFTTSTPNAEENRQGALQIRPGIMFQTGSPRLVWRASYLFAGSIGFYGPGATTYSNQLGLSLASQLSNRSVMTFSAGLVQGSTAFQLTQRPADAGVPAFRAPGNPAQVTANVGEAFAWEASEDLRLGQGLAWNYVAPQYDLSQSNWQLASYLALDRMLPSSGFGGELVSSVAWLRPLTADGAPYVSLTNSILGRWNHDLDLHWSGQLRAGVAQVLTLTGSYPLAILPTGGVTASYAGNRGGGSLSVTYGPQTNLQTGTVTQAGQALIRGFINFDPLMVRQLSASAGFMRSRPLGEVAPAFAVGTGDALQGDIGFIWALSREFLITTRYTVAYQYMQPLGVAPSFTQALLVGVTARYSTVREIPGMPTLGQRVDGTDAVAFPESDVPRKRAPPK